jgi:predicted PurR-regulated permease PerM
MTTDRDLTVRVAKATAAAIAVGAAAFGIWQVRSVLWLVVVREFQNDVVNPRIGGSVGLSPLVTLLCVSILGVLFGGLAVILAVPFTSAVATIIDVLVLDHEPPAAEPTRKRRLGHAG